MLKESLLYWINDIRKGYRRTNQPMVLWQKVLGPFAFVFIIILYVLIKYIINYKYFKEGELVCYKLKKVEDDENRHFIILSAPRYNEDFGNDSYHYTVYDILDMKEKVIESQYLKRA